MDQNPNRNVYIPPHLRKKTTVSPVFHFDTPWNPQREALKNWLVQKKWQTGGQLVDKVYGSGGTNPYYRVFYADALEFGGGTYHVILDIHVNGESGGAWCPGIKNSGITMRHEPGIPYQEIELLWGNDVKQLYTK